MSISLGSSNDGGGNILAGEAEGGGTQGYGSGVCRDGVAKMKGIFRFAPKPKEDGVDVSSWDPRAKMSKTNMRLKI
jgi:hypothetical protein